MREMLKVNKDFDLKRNPKLKGWKQMKTKI